MEHPFEMKQCALTDFLRYHVLVRVFQGDVAEWLSVLQSTDRDDSDDARFLRWLHRKIRSEPYLLERIRETVESSGLWPAEE
jgi:hypothetical protein